MVRTLNRAPLALLILSLGGLISAVSAQAGGKDHHYKLIDLGTFGGLRSYFSPGSGNDVGQYSRVLNTHGAVAGFANTTVPDPFPNFCFDSPGNCVVTRAFEAHDSSHLKDLGALPGGASSLTTWITDNGLIAGQSENGQLDALTGIPQFRAVLWQKGEIIDLGTLPDGGNQSYTAAINSRGQAVGAATNAVSDSNSMSSSTFFLPGVPYETRAFIWEKHTGMEDLGTLPGGTDAQAILINESGQVVGHSYTGSAPTSFCLYPLSTGSFIWERGKGIQDLGSLGGTCTTATDLNNRGQIVGASNLSGDRAKHAFLWDHGSMHDLGGSLGGSFLGAFAINDTGQAVGFATFPGGPGAPNHAVLWKQIGQLTDLGPLGIEWCSNANSINDRMQIVGSFTLCSGGPVSAFLWEDGTLFDLNSLIPGGSALHLQLTQTINNHGEIAGTGVDADGNQHAFLLIPCDGDHPGVEGCDDPERSR